MNSPRLCRSIRISVHSLLGVIFLYCSTGVASAQGWSSTDINPPVAQDPGSTTIDVNRNDVLDVTGGGLGIGGSTDSFRFVSKSSSGNLEAEAHLVEFDALAQNPLAEAGVMLRADLEENSAFAFVSITSNRELRFRWRSVFGSIAALSLGTTLPPDSQVWLRLVRSGITCSGYFSLDGINWTLVGSSSVTLSGVLQAGVAVTSSGSESLVKADFERALIIGNVPQRLSSGTNAGIRLWLRADSNVLYGSNSRVFKWEDMSGFANDAYADGGAISQNSPLIVHDSVGLKPGLRFDNNHYPSFAERRYLRVNHHETLMPARVSLFVVASMPNASLDSNMTAGLLSKGNGTTGYTLRFVNSIPRIMIPSTAKAWASTLPVNQPYLFEAVFDQTGGSQAGLRLFINGQLALGAVPQRSSPIAANTFPLFIGQYSTAPNTLNPSSTNVYPFTGDIAEAIVFNDAVSEAQRREIEAYFKSKYDITAMPTPQALTPTVNLLPGVYSSEQTLVITAAPGSLVWYRVNGGEPTRYTNPFALGDGTTSVTVWAEKQGHATSEELVVPIIIDRSTSYIVKNGLQLWLRADSGLTLAQNNDVLQWRSLVAPYFIASSGSVNRPVWRDSGTSHDTCPAVNFTQDWLRVTTPVGSSLALNKHTICFVAKPTQSNALLNPVLLSRMNANNGYLIGLNKTTSVAPFRLKSQFRNTNFITSTVQNKSTLTPPEAPILLDTWSTLLSRYDQQSVGLRVNGSLKRTESLNWEIGDSTSNLFIGAQTHADSVPTNPFFGDIAELIVYDRELSTYELRELDAYLLQRYQMPGAAAPVAELTVNPEPGIVQSGTSVSFSSSDNALITYSVNGGDVVNYTSGHSIALSEGNAIVRDDGVLCFAIHVTAEKPGFVSTTRELRYYVDPRITGLPLNNLRLWLRADTGVQIDESNSSSSVVRWEDQSGTGLHMTAPVEGVRPTLHTPVSGTPSIAFGETVLSALIPESPEAALTAFENSAVGQVTVLAVAKVNASSDNAAILEIKSTDNAMGLDLRVRTEIDPVTSLPRESLQSRFNGSTIKALAGGNPYLLPSGFNLFRQSASTTSGTSPSLRTHHLVVNRSASNSQQGFSHVPGAPAVFVLGSGFEAGNLTNPFSGEIAELMVFDRVLSESELSQIDAYLLHRYGLDSDNRVPSPVLAAAIASPSSGTWKPGTSVTLSHPLSGVTIAYRYAQVASFTHLDSLSLPWLDYEDPIQLDSPGPYFFQVRATKPGYTQSDDLLFSLRVDPVIEGLPRDGMILWLAADRGVQTFPGVNPPVLSQWFDESGRANHAHPATLGLAAANYPRYTTSQEIVYNELNQGEPLPAKVVDFVTANSADGRLRILNSQEFSSPAMTVFSVARTRNLVDQRILLRRSATANETTSFGGWTLSYNGRAADVDPYYVDVSIGGGTQAAGAIKIVTSNNSARQNRFKPSLITALIGQQFSVLPNRLRNGEEQIDAVWQANTAELGDDLYIGGHHTLANRFNGEVAEILIYNRHLEAVEIEAVQNYLSTKYLFGWQRQVSAPTISPNGGVYSSSQTITLTPASGAILHYEEDGILKSSTSSVQIALPADPEGGVNTKSISAWCEKTGYIASPKRHAFFAIDSLADLIPRGTDLQLWVRGDSAVVDGLNKVSRWVDMSGREHHLTKPAASAVNAPEKVAFASNGPFKGRPVLQFSSTVKSCLEGNFPGLNVPQASVFAIIRVPKLITSSTRIIAQKFNGGATPPTGYSLRQTYSGGSRFSFNTSVGTFFADNASEVLPVVIVGGSQGNSGRKIFYQSDVKSSALTPTSISLSPATTFFQVGGTNATNNLDGEIADIWVYSRELTQQEINQLGVYAHERYGANSNKQVPTPTANYLGGTFSTSVGINLSCSLPGATLRYELGGVDETDVSDPDSQSPEFTGQWPNQQILVDGRFRILKARATKPGYIDSDVQSWVFRIEPDKNIIRDGLVAWLRADRGVSADSNDRVSRWLDQTGLGNDAAPAIIAGRPLLISVTGSAVSNSFQAIRFNSEGTTQPYGLRIPHPQRFPNPNSTDFAQMSVIAIAKRVGINNVILLKKGGFEVRQVGALTTPRARIVTNATTSFTDVPIRHGEFEIITGTYNQVRRLISNAETFRTSAATVALTQNMNPIYIGSTVTGNSTANFQGDLAEIFIYNRALSEAERGHMESLLKSQYGIVTPASLTLPVPRLVPGPPNSPGLAAVVNVDEPIHVTISGPAGATIYYTTDSDQTATPSTDWARYTRPIPVNFSTAIYAFCRVEGAQAAQSAVTGTSYVLDPAKYPPPQEDENDSNPPTITLEQPANAVPIINP